LRPRTLLPVRRALPPELSPLSLHDALPISLTVTTTGTSFTLSGAPTGFSLEAGNVIHSGGKFRRVASVLTSSTGTLDAAFPADLDRKSTRLNSSHVKISYAAFCLKKKNINQ